MDKTNQLLEMILKGQQEFAKEVNEKFDQMGLRFGQLEVKLSDMETRLDRDFKQVNEKLDLLANEIGLQKQKIEDHDRVVDYLKKIK